MKKVYSCIVLLCLVFSDIQISKADNLCIVKEGAVIFEISAESVDSTYVKDGQIVLFGNKGQVLYSVAQTAIDSILFMPAVPRADILDVKFNADGSATDISPMHNTVEGIGNPQTRFNDRFGCYAAHFDNPWSGTAAQWYKISYATSQAIQDALADGHTFESMVRFNFDPPLSDSEAKWFSSHQSGGSGFLISKKQSVPQQTNQICFLPHVGGSWKWANSQVVPEPGVWYHIVGVWNQSEGKAYIYINGELKNTIAASGSFKFPSKSCYYFCIGADPSSATVANTSIKGDVLMARVYDSPLTADEVAAVWKRVSTMQGVEQADMVTEVKTISGLKVLAGKGYYIYGEGFADGDQIYFQSNEGSVSYVSQVEMLASEKGCIRVNLPVGLQTGGYRLFLVRGERKQDLGNVRFELVDELPQGSQVIAHRGHWNLPGSAQNSRSSLKNALSQHFFGSETDVWLTTDGHVVVNHDATLNGVTLQTSTYEQVKNLTLSNGEKIPELQDFLNILAEDDGPTKLIIEVKNHSTEAKNCQAIDSCMAMVKRMGLENRVEYISFSLEACKEVVKNDPTAKVAYLKGNLTPDQLHQLGITGLDYTQAKTSDEAIARAHELGMTINIWTIDAESDIIYTNHRGADFVTTNNPEAAARIYRHYRENR